MNPFDADPATTDQLFAEITAGWVREPRDGRDSAYLIPMVIASWLIVALIVWGVAELVHQIA